MATPAQAERREPDPAKRAARKAKSIGPSPWDESHRKEASVPKGKAWLARWDADPAFRAAATERGQALKRAVQEAHDYSPIKMEKIVESMRRMGGKAEELVKKKALSGSRKLSGGRR